MPRHHGGGVTNLSRGGKGVDGLAPGVRVTQKGSTRPGPTGHPKRGKSPGTPQAAAREGEQQARNPRK